MTYHLALWDSNSLQDTSEARAAYDELRDLYLSGPRQTATALVLKIKEALASRWPSETDEERTAVTSQASGPLLLIAISGPGRAEAVEYVAGLARAHDLVCFDPQTKQLLP
ncbi:MULTISPECIES: hypothetical protein [Streptomyces]|uniref:hypothetical protein n=1 Tax=Streptomyces TaxID=1883 RepID=UPI000C27C5B2|nr:hypothetical protein [Streptomyces sp. CB01201]PJN01459.1 hypothetical protein CG740_19965 [Streptomyces sp. CB01201]